METPASRDWSLQCTYTTSGLFSEVGDILCPTYLHIHRFWIFEWWRTNQYQTETVIQSETTLCQLANTHIKKAANPWCSWPIHHCDRSQRCCLSQLLPWALGKISHKPTQMQVLEEAVKKGSSIYPTCGCFQGWEQCCLYGVVLSLSGHSQEWLLSCDGHCINQFWCSHLAMFAGRELDKRRTRRERGETGWGRSWRQSEEFHRKIDRGRKMRTEKQMEGGGGNRKEEEAWLLNILYSVCF